MFVKEKAMRQWQRVTSSLTQWWKDVLKEQPRGSYYTIISEEHYKRHQLGKCYHGIKVIWLENKRKVREFRSARNTEIMMVLFSCLRYVWQEGCQQVCNRYM